MSHLSLCVQKIIAAIDRTITGIHISTWLKTLDIEYADAVILLNSKTQNKKNKSNKSNKENVSLKMTIDGYAYSINKIQQFRLVNKFSRTLKSNIEFSKIFQNIDLETTTAQKLNDHNVTYFKIVCKQTK